jgi:glutamine synthetase adenylyltransferase
MKIEDLLPLSITPSRPEAKPTGEADFAQHLKEALTADTQGTAASEALTGLEQLTAINPVAEINRTPTEVLDTVLSRLDNYREALAQPDLPLKKLANLVQNLEEDSQRLQSLAQSLPASSPLKQVMEEAAALAYTESFKFNRGDYV